MSENFIALVLEEWVPRQPFSSNSYSQAGKLLHAINTISCLLAL